jgi:hypothetical protein
MAGETGKGKKRRTVKSLVKKEKEIKGREAEEGWERKSEGEVVSEAGAR